MPDISSPRLTAGRNLTSTEMKALVVDGSKTAMEAYMKKKHKWNGTEPGAILAAHLNADNARINKFTMNLLGSLKGDYFSANRFWPGVPPTYKMKLSFHSLTVVDLKDGMTSDIMDIHEDIVKVKNNETRVTLADIKAAGAGNLSFCTFCIPISADYVKVTAIGFPYSKCDLLTEHPASTNPMFPGMTIINRDILFMPSANEDTPWGATFKPLIVKGSASYLKTSSFDLRAKAAHFLRNCLKAPSCTTIDRLTAQWATVDGPEGEAALTVVRPKDLWPLAVDIVDEEETEGDSGKNLFFKKFVS